MKTASRSSGALSSPADAPDLMTKRPGARRSTSIGAPVLAVYSYDGALMELASLDDTLEVSCSDLRALAQAPGDRLFMGSGFSDEYELTLSDGTELSGDSFAGADPMVAELCPTW